MRGRTDNLPRPAPHTPASIAARPGLAGGGESGAGLLPAERDLIVALARALARRDHDREKAAAGGDTPAR